MRGRFLMRYLRGPEHPGKLRVVDFLGRTALPAQGIVVPVSEDLRLYLHPRDWIEYLILTGVPYEPRTLAFLGANLSPGDGAIFAGVNFGLHVARAAVAVGPEGVVIGVEPQPSSLLRAKANLDLNGLASRVRLVQAALGRTSGLVHLPWPAPGNPGATSLLQEGEGSWAALLPLCDVVGLLDGRSFRLLLLDVEGYEREILAGSNLSQGPDLAIVELERSCLARSGVTAEEIAGLLRDGGYALFDLNGCAAVDLLDLPENNLVAVRPGVKVTWPAREESLG